MSNRNRAGIPVFAVILVTVGIVFLLQNLDILPRSVWSNIWRFWPVVVILIGVSIIFQASSKAVASAVAIALIVLLVGVIAFASSNDRFGREAQVTNIAEPLGDLRTVQVNVDFGAGQLKVGALPNGSPNIVEGRLENPGDSAEAEVTRNGSDGTLVVSMGDAGGFPWSGGGNIDWTLDLSRTAEIKFDLDSGAADMDLDLTELRATNIDISTGAADLEVAMPANAGRVTAKISAGAADISIRIPEGVAARISNDSGLSSIDINADRFPKVGDVHQSSDYETAVNRIDLHISVGASDVTVR